MLVVVYTFGFNCDCLNNICGFICCFFGEDNSKSTSELLLEGDVPETDISIATVDVCDLDSIKVSRDTRIHKATTTKAKRSVDKVKMKG